MKRSFRIARSAAVGVVVFVLSCMSSNSVTNPPVQTQSVTIQNSAFSPASITVAVGSTVTWTNKDAIAHTTTSDATGWDSGSLAQNADFAHTFAVKGTFSYHCSIHPFMTGTVTVQ